MDINVFFEQLGTTFAQGSIEDICALFEKSLHQAGVEGDSNATIAILNEKAGFYRNISQYEEALKAAEKALSLMISLGYADTVAYGTSLLNAGTAYRAAGDLSKAMEYFTKARAIFENRLEAHDHRFAGLYNNMGAACQEMELYGEALKMLEKAAAIMGQIPDMGADRVTVLGNLAVVQFKTGNNSAAQSTLEQARGIMAAEPPSGKVPEYAVAFACMGEAFYRAGNHAWAAEAYEKALGMVQGAFGENRDYATLCFNCAKAYDKLEQTDRASAYIKKGTLTLERLGLSG